MIKIKTSCTTVVIVCLLLLSGPHSFSQESGCKVLIPAISGKYSGGCRKGLANGKGTAQGVDNYVGSFKNGLPNGTGTYTWSDGAYYEGQWKKGLRDGKGVLVNSESTLSGYWKDNNYLGAKIVAPYEIIRKESVERSTITKRKTGNENIRIRLVRGGVENSGISDLSIFASSGTEFKMGPSTGIENMQFPVYIKIKFRAWNYFRTTQYDVIFELNINEPGSWDINVAY